MKSKLQTKIILTATLILAIIISVVVIYFYNEGENFLTNQATEKIEATTNEIVGLLERNTTTTRNEITSLYTELCDIDKQHSEKRIRKEYLIDHTKRFLLAYAKNYDKIILKCQPNDSVITIFPIKDFSGKITIQSSTAKLDPQNILDGFHMIDSSSNNQVSYSAYLNSHSVWLKTTSKNNGLEVYASTALLRMFEYLPTSVLSVESYSVFVFDKRNNIVFSTNKKFVNKNIEKIYPQEVVDGLNKIKRLENKIILSKENKLYGLKFLVEYNLANEIKLLDKFLTNSVLFGVFSFIVLSLIIILVTKRFIKNLTKITDVAKNVSKGNFDKKIELKRDDELGLLMDTFDLMIDRLKLSYAKLQITNKELEEKIEELLQTKNELNEKQRLALIGETISKISHEIQNKIGGISIWVQNLEMLEELDSTAKLYVEEIKTVLNSFLDFLNNFKKFYRKPVLEKSEINLEELINRTRLQLEDQLKEKQLTIDLQIDPLLRINGDASLLENVLLNIISNAIYYSPLNSTISIFVKYIKDLCQIFILDEGNGIEIENIKDIFNPFFTTKSTGSGLGLATSKNIIEAHGGKITAENNMDAGAKFIIILPIN